MTEMFRATNAAIINQPIAEGYLTAAARRRNRRCKMQQTE
jgi:hypothetical protein